MGLETNGYTGQWVSKPLNILNSGFGNQWKQWTVGLEIIGYTGQWVWKLPDTLGSGFRNYWTVGLETIINTLNSGLRNREIHWTFGLETTRYLMFGD